MEERIFLFLEIVKEVPKGKVASYKQIAALAGYPKNARLVGKILSNAQLYGNYPCHRIVHQDGQLVSFWKEQKELLEKEDVGFLANGKVDMKKYQWEAKEDGN